MSISFICRVIKRRKRHRLRSMMRGYRLLKNTNQIGLIRRLKADLIDTRFTRIDQTALPVIFGAAFSQAELATRQFLLQRIAGVSLNKALLYSLGTKGTPVIFPLPRVWQNVLIDHGFKVARARSSLAWLCFVGSHLCFGALTIARLAATSLRTSMRLRQTLVPNQYSYFDGLTSGNLPQPFVDGRSYDIVTWYSQWEGRANSLDSLCHGVHAAKPTEAGGIRVEYIGRPVQPLTNLVDLLCFIGWALRATIRIAIDVFTGRWWHALLLRESAKANIIRLTESKNLARDYLFHYSATIYRPLWTYEAEEKKSRIISYFYSTSEQVKLPQRYVSQKYEYGALNWPIILVWDEYQVDLLRRYIGNKTNIEVVGPIYFQDFVVKLPKIPKRAIAVFDVQKHRDSTHFGFSTLAEYLNQNPGLNIQFIKDIHLVLEECGGSLILKRKREIGNRSVKKYMGLIQKLSQSGAMIHIDPGVSPIRVIEKCAGVISMCFASTALYMQDQDIPSVYYDPSGWIQKDDRGGHGIPILSGIDELRGWLSCVFAEKKSV